jgi:flagellar biosynthesis chaperone FliJ
MRSTIKKTKKSRDALASTSQEKRKIISEKDIRYRAFEIFQEDHSSSFSELDNWYYAERELSGYYR